MKLEGSGPVGYQTVSMAGIRDHKVMQNPMKWVEAVSKAGIDKLERTAFPKTAIISGCVLTVTTAYLAWMSQKATFRMKC